MSEFEQKVLAELAALRLTVEEMRSDLSVARITYFENLSPSAVVGADYVAYRFGCSEEAVIRGRFRTDEIPRIRKKPAAFIKRDVDSVWLALNETNKDKAAKYRHEAAQAEGKRKSKTRG